MGALPHVSNPRDRRRQALPGGFGVCFSLALALAAATLGGCGYGFSAGAGLETVAKDRPVTLGTIENRSREADAALVASRFLARGVAARATGGAAPAAVLAGGVESVVVEPIGFGGIPGPTQQEVTVWRATVRITLVLRDGAGVVLARSDVTGSEEFLPGSDLEATEVSRRVALHRLIERVAGDALDRLAKP